VYLFPISWLTLSRMAHLPHPLVIERSPLETTNELGLHIRSRYLMCRSWIHQPFLHFLIHAAAHQLEDHEAKVETMASICLQCAIEVTNDVTAHHRHHGTWFVVRMLWSCLPLQSLRPSRCPMGGELLYNVSLNTLGIGRKILMTYELRRIF
jgi:hypothetical protein